MSQEIVHIAVNSVDSLDVTKSRVNECNKCLELKTELLKKKDLIEQDVYDKLMKTQSQEKDTVIRKLKDRIKSLSGKDSVENVKKDIDEIETINIELEHSVAKLLSENENLRKEREHLKSIYKDQFDSIRKTRVQSKEHCDSLIAQINAKSVENSDLNAQLQEKVFAITALKNELRKLKGKNVVDTAVSKPNATIAPGMFKLDIEPISHKLKNNRDAHEVYIEKTIENTDTLRGFTCPNSPKPSEKLVAVTPMNKDKRVRFAEPVTSSSNIPKQADSLKTKDSNKPLLTSTGVKHTTSASRSKPSGTTKNHRIMRHQADNGTEFVNQTLRDYYEEVRISHQTSVTRTPQQNDVVKRRNHTLVEAARTMLIFLKALLFLWAELTAMDSEQFSSGPAPKLLTPGTISLGLVPNIPSSTPYALTANPTIYVSLIEQFWQTATVETVNDEEQ
ncbi:retrovirus-related pol polyprotein from transposon TNT 1-94 [Tanacetum coccineum]